MMRASLIAAAVLATAVSMGVSTLARADDTTTTTTTTRTDAAPATGGAFIGVPGVVGVQVGGPPAASEGCVTHKSTTTNEDTGDSVTHKSTNCD